MGRARAWLRAVSGRKRSEQEMGEEMMEHLAASVSRLMKRGMTRTAAEKEARREFGNVTVIQEEAREARGVRWLHDAMQDFRTAARRMRKTPTLTAAIVLTLGLGLGAAAAIFTISQAALIDSLPYVRPDRLVHLWETRTAADDRSPTSYPTFLDWRTAVRGFSAVEGYDASNLTIGLGDEARMLRGARTSSGFFRMLGVRLTAGRDFLMEEGAAGDANVAIVSERFARSAAGGSVLHGTITVNGTPHTVIGILPATFHFALLQNADVFVPLAVSEQQRPARSQRFISVVGRLANDVSLLQVRAELSGVMSTLAGEHPDAMGGRTVTVIPLRDALIGSMKPIVSSLLIAVGVLLAIMAANLALLMLTRYVERTAELSLRAALGASRARILRQLLMESVLPSALGACLALIIGQMATRALLAAIPDGVQVGMPYLAHVSLNGTTIGVIVGLSMILAVAFGIGPALLMVRLQGQHGDRRSTLTRSDRRLRRGLVGVQVALTVVLLVSSGLLVMSFTTLIHRDVGVIDPASVITARAPLSGPRFEQPEAQQQFYDALIARAGELPGIRGVGAISEVPGGGGGVSTFEPVDHLRPLADRDRAAIRTVAGDYFAAVGIPVVAGRMFESHDGMMAPRVAVVSAGFAKLLAADGVTIGRRIRLIATDSIGWEVVGVVADVQAAALDAAPPAVLYLSHRQAAENRMMLVLRTSVSARTIEREVGTIVKALDAGVPLYAVSTLDQQLSESKAVFSRRLPMVLCGVFAAGALALTLIALYAICAHEGSTRRREFGIRLALGSSAHSIRQLMLRDIVILSVGGILVGEAVALAVSRSLQAVLFGISPADARVYIAVAVSVIVCACLASLAPAIRAGAQDPAIVMRGG